MVSPSEAASIAAWIEVKPLSPPTTMTFWSVNSAISTPLSVSVPSSPLPALVSVMVTVVPSVLTA